MAGIFNMMMQPAIRKLKIRSNIEDKVHYSLNMGGFIYVHQSVA